jgi:hypothetical protein
MATSAVAISNLALSRIGISAAIAALSESSQEAVACNACYEQVRDEVLRDFPWPFARTFVALGLVTEAAEEDDLPPWGNDWAYAYRFPSDCIKARRITTGDRTGNTRVPFQLGNDASGRLIYTDEADAVLVYTKRFTDPAHFDPTFASAVAWRMAVELAAPLARSAAERERAEASYRNTLLQAQTDALNEEVDDDPGEASWITARE